MVTFERIRGGNYFKYFTTNLKKKKSYGYIVYNYILNCGINIKGKPGKVR